jgi:hypothetical protein
MRKINPAFIVFLAAHLSMISAGAAPFGKSPVSKPLTVCGFKFAAVNGLAVTATPISKKSLRTRIDNERYDACPYNVEITYGEVRLRLDVSRDVTLERVRDSDEESSVRTAFFRHGEGGWEAIGDDVSIEKDDMATHESKHSMSLSGVLRRRSRDASKQDFCFSLDVIGEEKYLSGAVCRSRKQELEPMKVLFSKSPVILSERDSDG